ncbi:hypothetical protein [Chryseobacterium sp.]|uniref:hypothetical protein n=1 Tax=Chryseobacterium sp. TaxID=1871047 RepID=UPI00388E3E3D
MNNHHIDENPSTLPVEHIRNLVANYRSKQQAYINQNMGFEDANSIHFDLRTLKKFISDMELLAKLEDPNITDVDLGIRFYYAAYPEFPESSLPEDYALRHTLVLIPTINKEVEGEIKNMDYNPLENSLAPIVTDREILALAQNHGTLSPPSTNCIESY